MNSQLTTTSSFEPSFGILVTEDALGWRFLSAPCPDSEAGPWRIYIVEIKVSQRAEFVRDNLKINHCCWDLKM